MADYDRELIAEMLEAYERHTSCDTDLVHLESSILEQARLLREADNADAARVGTGRADDIHTCSYQCDRPACIKAQRDELAGRAGVGMDEAAAVFALRALVAAGYVTQQKVDHALELAMTAGALRADGEDRSDV